ncbi:DUF2971 family protein [Natranaerovirga hydrolytica]|uniref:DUF2971 family protein n=1 Tax=Natranaerovirga hydrolytica TaxID=680378 RepID=A0A4R1MXT3_9FIRM|nr:DUF2971 domain-containing protein [Natranaerovirga hydrolytica]TCK98016.1 DUF2971 family protein [Natranaerovirga hydrolytica]
MTNDFVNKLPDDEEELKLLDQLLLNTIESKDDKDEEKLLEFNFENNPNIYHYTSPVGLKEIIAHNSLWFTHYKFLNDRSEKYYCFDLFKRCIEREKSELKKTFYNTILSHISVDGNLNYEAFYNEADYYPDYYVASFSLNSNSLSMWNYYTKTTNKTGYNISFKSKELINSLENKSFYRYKVNYNTEEQLKEIMKYIYAFNNAWDSNRSEIFLKWLRYLLLDLIDITSLRFKHPAFANEEEFRIVYKVDENNREKIGKEELLEFRESNGIIVPYLNVRFDKNSIGAVKISPTQQEEIAKEGLLMMLRSMGYNHLTNRDITTSDIPLRN